MASLFAKLPPAILASALLSAAGPALAAESATAASSASSAGTTATTDPSDAPAVSATSGEGDAGDQKAAPAAWTPLQIGNFGTELGQKWIPVPNGSSGAPRQGWLATADGFFTREAHLAYDYTDGRGFEAHEVLARFNYPLTRRLWAGIEVPFFQQTRSIREFGDVTLNTLVMLHESRNVSINAGVGWRLPTGTVAAGNKVFSAQPQLNFWSDVGHGFSLRGRVGYDLPDSGRSDAFVLNGAIGQTITPHSEAPFGDLTWYVAANWRSPSRGSDFVSITPGMRTHLGRNLFLLFGVEFPVTSQAQSFNQRYIIQFVQGF